MSVPRLVPSDGSYCFRAPLSGEVGADAVIAFGQVDGPAGVGGAVYVDAIAGLCPSRAGGGAGGGGTGPGHTGVSQCQASVDEVLRRAATELDVVDEEGFRTGENVCRPRSLLVVGSLDQFIRDDEPNIPMFENFERFRRSLRNPEIVTFDDLFARAAMSLALADQSQVDQQSDALGPRSWSSDWYGEEPS